MKKIIYALLIALNISNVHAMEANKPASTETTAISLKDAVAKRISSNDNLTAEEKAGVIAWAKENKVIVAAIVFTALTAATAGSLYYFQDNDFVNNHTVLSTPVAWINAGVTNTGAGYTYVKDTAVAHPKTSIALCVAAVAVAFAAYDYSKDEKASLIKSALATLSKKEEVKTAVAA